MPPSPRTNLGWALDQPLLHDKLRDHDVALDKLELPLIADDSGTLVHVIWRNGQLVDLTGTPWTQVGAVAQIAAAGGMPAGARGFDGANHYETASPADPVDITGFAACAIVAPTAADLSGTSMILNNGYSAPSSGWELVANEAGLVKWISASEVNDSPLIADQPNVICFGQDSSIGKMYLKVNMRPLKVGTGVITPLPDQPLKIGTHFDNVLGFAGTMYEIWFSSALPGGLSAGFYGPELWDEYFAEITRRAFARMGVPVLSASQVVYQTPANIHLASTNQRLELVVTNGTAFTIAAPTAPIPGTTIRAGQRFTLKIKNSSGGALGAVTWNAIYKMAAWTSPANATNRSITFEFDGTNWIEVSRTTADVPN